MAYQELAQGLAHKIKACFFVCPTVARCDALSNLCQSLFLSDLKVGPACRAGSQPLADLSISRAPLGKWSVLVPPKRSPQSYQHSLLSPVSLFTPSRK
jgi:hypothetical protein